MPIFVDTCYLFAECDFSCRILVSDLVVFGLCWYQWLNTKLWYLQSMSHGYTTVLQAVDMFLYSFVEHLTSLIWSTITIKDINPLFVVNNLPYFQAFLCYIRASSNSFVFNFLGLCRLVISFLTKTSLNGNFSFSLDIWTCMMSSK